MITEKYNRELLIEKRFVPDYIDDWGQEIWVDRYGAHTLYCSIYIRYLHKGEQEKDKWWENQ